MESNAFGVRGMGDEISPGEGWRIGDAGGFSGVVGVEVEVVLPLFGDVARVDGGGGVLDDADAAEPLGLFLLFFGGGVEVFAVGLVDAGGVHGEG